MEIGESTFFLAKDAGGTEKTPGIVGESAGFLNPIQLRADTWLCPLTRETLPPYGRAFHS
jgi:hypothetical protein